VVHQKSPHPAAPTGTACAQHFYVQQQIMLLVGQ